MTNKLFELQNRIKPIKKDSENPFYKSKYFDINSLIEEIKPHMDEMGIICIQPIKVEEGRNVLYTRLIDAQAEIGTVILAESSIILPDNIDPQKMGSAITYYRRYSLQSLLFLQAEDDDANLASEKTTYAKKETKSIPEGMVATTCPLCKGEMIKRTGKMGDFYGCKSFPKCKGIINIKQI